jgi:hypothetical protein
MKPRSWGFVVLERRPDLIESAELGTMFLPFDY